MGCSSTGGMSTAFGTRVRSGGNRHPKAVVSGGAEQPLPCQGSRSQARGRWEKGKVAKSFATRET